MYESCIIILIVDCCQETVHQKFDVLPVCILFLNVLSTSCDLLVFLILYFSDTVFNICGLKVGEVMNKKKIIEKIITDAGGIAKTSEFVSAGLSNFDVANLCNAGYIERIRHGYYQLSERASIQEEQLIASLLPESVVCVESALFFYGYSDFTPRQWSIAVPRTFSRTRLKIDFLSAKIYYIQNSLFEIGKTTGNFNGVQLAVYDRERTICDCFKYRTKIDNEMFNKSLNAYIADDKKNLRNLSNYAKEMHVYTKLMNVMEVLLNG